MQVAFTLSMPGVGSWNGRWSGEGRHYVIVRHYAGKKAIAAIEERLAASKYWHYRWSDGWAAGVSARVVDAREARKLRAKSDGFCGYDWMVDSIEDLGKILADHERKQAVAGVS